MSQQQLLSVMASKRRVDLVKVVFIKSTKSERARNNPAGYLFQNKLSLKAGCCHYERSVNLALS